MLFTEKDLSAFLHLAPLLCMLKVFKRIPVGLLKLAGHFHRREVYSSYTTRKTT
jgi:hypothetical protein